MAVRHYDGIDDEVRCSSPNAFTGALHFGIVAKFVGGDGGWRCPMISHNSAGSFRWYIERDTSNRLRFGTSTRSVM